jgi:hypothetical protein
VFWAFLEKFLSPWNFLCFDIFWKKCMELFVFWAI